MGKLVYVPTNISLKDFMNGGNPFQDAAGNRVFYENMEQAWRHATIDMRRQADKMQLACVCIIDKDPSSDYLLESDIQSVRFSVYDSENSPHRGTEFTLYRTKDGLDYDHARLMTGITVLYRNPEERKIARFAYIDEKVDVKSWALAGGINVPASRQYELQEHIGELLKAMPFEQRTVMAETFLAKSSLGCYQMADAIQQSYDVWCKEYKPSAEVREAYIHCKTAAELFDKQYEAAMLEYVKPEVVVDVMLSELRSQAESVMHDIRNFNAFESRFHAVYDAVPNPTYEDIFVSAKYASRALSNDKGWSYYMRGTDNITEFAVAETIRNVVQAENLLGGVHVNGEVAGYATMLLNETLNTMGLADRALCVTAINEADANGCDTLEAMQAGYNAVANAHNGHVPSMIEEAFKQDMEWYDEIMHDEAEIEVG